MTREPINGDRVRVCTRELLPDYAPGATGHIVSGPHPLPSGGDFYVVVMDGDSSGKATVFHADEIERDETATPVEAEQK
jgi:hypothetical protein